MKHTENYSSHYVDKKGDQKIDFPEQEKIQQEFKNLKEDIENTEKIKITSVPTLSVEGKNFVVSNMNDSIGKLISEPMELDEELAKQEKPTQKTHTITIEGKKYKIYEKRYKKPDNMESDHRSCISYQIREKGSAYSFNISFGVANPSQGQLFESFE